MTLTLQEVVDEFQARRTEASKTGSATTGKRYAHDVKKWADWLENTDKTVYDADYYDLTARLTEMKREGYAVSTLKSYVAAVSKFYQDLAKMGDSPNFELPEEAPENPYDRFDDDDRKRFLKDGSSDEESLSEEKVHYLTPTEIEELVEHAPAPKLRNQLLLRLLFDTGCRRGELANIRIEGDSRDDWFLDRDDHSIRIGAFKSSDTRTVTYTPEYIDRYLDLWLDSGYRDAVPNSDESPFLFPTHERDRISGKRINVIVKEAAESAGLQRTTGNYVDGRTQHKIGAHTLRHSHAVQAIKSGIDVRRLMASLGHSDLDVTLTYLQIVERDYVEDSRDFNPFGGEE
ncbi:MULTISPECIES: tyrosine-type recombinase/integrase [Haloarcula]|uniref:tyrosine-type recombinase/integrase n=1 Tax=Haloarcula TaxID=2237 RepID=UPI0023E810F5|nr:site-specific integrase [Halomicroarcula sp. SHR3]